MFVSDKIPYWINNIFLLTFRPEIPHNTGAVMKQNRLKNNVGARFEKLFEAGKKVLNALKDRWEKTRENRSGFKFIVGARIEKVLAFGDKPLLLLKKDWEKTRKAWTPYLERFQRQGKLFIWFTDNTPAASLLALIICFILIVNATWCYSSKGHWEGVLVELWGMLFDLLVIGIFVTGLLKFGERRQKIKNYINTIYSFRGLKDPEVTARIREAVISLIGMGVHEIELIDCFLEKSDFSYCDLKKSRFSQSNMRGADFFETHLEDTKFIGSNLSNASLWSAKLNDAHFRNADLNGADLSMAVLTGVQFIETNLTDVDFSCAIWEEDVETVFNKLSKAKSLYNAKEISSIVPIGPELYRMLDDKRRDLLFDRPPWYKEVEE